jgi:hypothetical protein
VSGVTIKLRVEGGYAIARHVYFAFDYRDVFAVNQIRRCGQFLSVAAAGFADDSQWERLRKKTDATIQRVIDASLHGTSVTVVCVGLRTAARKWVTYELRQSALRGNGLLGVYLPGESGHPKPAALGTAPLYQWNSSRFPVWVEEAASRARG